MAELNPEEVVTRRECDAVMDSVSRGLKGIEDKLDTLNGFVAENTRFRVQSKAVYGVLAFGWASMMIPLAAIAIAVLK